MWNRWDCLQIHYSASSEFIQSVDSVMASQMPLLAAACTAAQRLHTVAVLALRHRHDFSSVWLDRSY